MPEQHRPAPAPWQFPVAVEEVAEEGQHVDLVADAETRAAVARVAGLRDLPRLQASFDLTRQGEGGLHVAGHVSATVGQVCVVTLEPLTNEVAEEVDLVFMPPSAPKDVEASAHKPGTPKPGAREQDTREPSARDASRDDVEPLIGGSVDLGALATEFLILGLDPYPRKPGAVFQPPADLRPDEGPFAALAALKKGRDGA